MIKIVITKEDPAYRGHTRLQVGWTGYITKETARVTERYKGQLDVPSTNIRFAAGLLGYEGREPVHCWVQNTNFKVVE